MCINNFYKNVFWVTCLLSGPKRKRREPQQLKNVVVFSSNGAGYEYTQNMSMEDEQKSVQNY